MTKNLNKLKKLEKRIDTNIKAAWYQNGLLLMQIRDEGLYKEPKERGDNGFQKSRYTTFEEYIEKRWEFSKRRGYQLLSAADLTQKIAQTLPETLTKKDEKSEQIVHFLPANEGQIRPLLDNLSTDSERVAVWHNAVGEAVESKTKITQDFIQKKVDEFLASGEVVEDIEFKQPEKVNLSTGVTHSSEGVNDWYTPKEHIEAARAVLGGIDTDPASSNHAQLTVQAAQYFTKETNALDKEWKGRVFMNPPYSMPEIKQFTDKLIEEFDAGRVTEAVVLTNNSSDTTWFHQLLNKSSAACLTKGRVPFYSLDNKTMATRQGQCFFYLGDKTQEFLAVFKQYGAVIQVL